MIEILRVSLFLMFMSLITPLFYSKILDRGEYIVDRDIIDCEIGPYKIKQIDVFEVEKINLKLKLLHTLQANLHVIKDLFFHKINCLLFVHL